jgi:ATP phosphoribosyltransferase
VIAVAVSKGKLLAGTEALFAQAGLPFPRPEGRRLVAEVDGFRFLFVKDADAPTYVEYGVAACGIAGKDVLLEARSDVLEPLDLGFGRCRLVVARRRGAPSPSSSTLRVATKYPGVTASHFLGKGVSVEVVPLSGSVELAPGLGLADVIVDVVETGRTLAENGLEVVEEVAASSARLIVNRARFQSQRGELMALIETLRRAAA